jgi:hypothetical protein
LRISLALSLIRVKLESKFVIFHFNLLDAFSWLGPQNFIVIYFRIKTLETWKGSKSMGYEVMASLSAFWVSEKSLYHYL